MRYIVTLQVIDTDIEADELDELILDRIGNELYNRGNQGYVLVEPPQLMDEE